MVVCLQVRAAFHKWQVCGCGAISLDRGLSAQLPCVDSVRSWILLMNPRILLSSGMEMIKFWENLNRFPEFCIVGARRVGAL